MKKLYRIFVPAALVAIAAAAPAGAYAQFNLGSLGQSLGGIVENLAEGVFSKSNLDISDIAGEWTSEGSAISFKSENLLKKAGGSAAAGMIESKIDPYYEKLGLNNAVLTINPDSTFTFKAKLITLNGTISRVDDGVFSFNFKALGKVSLGSVNTYISKSGSNMDVMFDASKLKTLLSGISKVANIDLLKTATSFLDSYDGLCIGFKMKQTGKSTVQSATTPSTSTTSTENSTTTTTKTQDVTSKLKNLLNK